MTMQESTRANIVPDSKRDIEILNESLNGEYFCLGASLARMETRIVFEEISKRLPEYQVSGPVERLYSGAFRGLLSVPIEFES